MTPRGGSDRLRMSACLASRCARCHSRLVTRVTPPEIALKWSDPWHAPPTSGRRPAPHGAVPSGRAGERGGQDLPAWSRLPPRPHHDHSRHAGPRLSGAEMAQPHGQRCCAPGPRPVGGEGLAWRITRAGNQGRGLPPLQGRPERPSTRRRPTYPLVGGWCRAHQGPDPTQPVRALLSGSEPERRPAFPLVRGDMVGLGGPEPPASS